MRRRHLLALPLAALLSARCGGGGDAVVSLATKGAVPGTSPTPTTTPVPAPELVVSTEDVYQGGTVLLSLVGEVKEGSVTFLGRTSPLTQGSQSIYTFIGVGSDDPPGEHPMRVDFTLVSGSKGTLSSSLTVLANAWTVDSVVLPPRLAPLLDPQVSADEVALLGRVYNEVTTTKLWKPGWIAPIGGPVTTRFGEQRSYNSAPASGHHSGTDIGAGEGTEVSVCNGGIVALARQLKLRGNMVVVDHGGGLYSGYAHLHSFSVAEGQLLATGDVVGLVGSTGLSTGAHLHWEMSAGGVLVDAYRFVDGSNGF